MVKFLLATMFMLYVFIVSISCSVFLLDNAEGNEGAHPTDITQCLDYRGLPIYCPAGATDCGFLKCTGGVFAGCLHLEPGMTPAKTCSNDQLCHNSGKGTLTHGAHVCQVCETKNCNTGKDGDGHWYPH